VTTPTPPAPTDPLLTLPRLAVWAQESPLQDVPLADLIIEAVSVLLRQYGDPTWTIATLPPRARDIGYIVAKDYYLNPRQLRQETTGPLQESVNDSTLNGINLTDAQKAELAAMVVDAPNEVDGLFTLGFTRGPVETNRRHRRRDVLIYDTRGEWPIPYLDESENFAFQPDGLSTEHPDSVGETDGA
jgi:hypothetical protein